MKNNITTTIIVVIIIPCVLEAWWNLFRVAALG
jgi:hypothetical protein